jgi:SAM-dependent methyltransferase
MGVTSLAAEHEWNRTMTAALRPAALAFDAIASEFDARFGTWLSVAAQRRAVRSTLLSEFPAGGRIIELGGGTGEDASFLAARGFRIHLTDSSPAMVSVARAKLARVDSQADVVAAEEMNEFAGHYLAAGKSRFDGAFSNFAPLNCVLDLAPTARGLARLLKHGAPAILVFFGTLCPGEMLTELLRRRPHLALRRLRQGQIPARLANREFSVIYHHRAAIRRAFGPWFVLEKRMGIGVTVPPSAAEPWISQHPRLLAGMEKLDQLLSRPLALFGDHVLYQFRRTDVEPPSGTH